MEGFSRVCRAQGDRLAAALAFLLLAAVKSDRTTLKGLAPAYWSGWADQSHYFVSARAFLHGALRPDLHWYPLLYPLLLAPFAALPDFYASLAPDLLCYLAALAGFQLVAARFGVGRWLALGLFLAATILYPRIASQWLIPWTTTLSAALIWLALGLASRFAGPPARRPALGLSCGLGALLGLIPLCRPADAVLSGLIGLCLLGPLLARPGGWRGLAALCAGGVAVIAAYLGLYLAIYGPHPTPYMRLSAAFGLDFARLGWKAYVILIEPRPWYPYGQGMLTVLPWLPLGAAGLLLMLARRGRRWLTALLALPAFAYTVMMLAYTDLLPSGLWRYNNIHYFKWLLPLLALFAWLWLRQCRQRPAAALALAVVLLPACLHLRPVAAGPREPARLVLFSSPPVSFQAVYFGRSLVADRLGPQYNLLDIHLVPGRDGLIYAEALRRPFAGDEEWNVLAGIPPGRPDTGLVGDEVTLPGPFPRPALARFRPAPGLGWPCWLPPYLCAAPLSLK